MKRLFYLAVYATVCVLFFSSCEAPIKDAGHIRNSAILLVSQEKEPGKVLYGAKYQDKISIPPVFDRFEAAMQLDMVYAYKGNKCALFNIDGTEVLSGRRCSSKELWFEPLWIDPSKKSRQSDNSAQTYCGKIFCIGEYYKFSLLDGRVSALFLPMSNPVVQGPYDEFLPGCSGFMFKDGNGWGATLLRIKAKTHNRAEIVIDETPLAGGERFDRIIEVVKSDNHSVWFTEKGKQWRSVDVQSGIGQSAVIKEVPIDQKLLTKVLKMPVRKQAKTKTYFDLASNQRVGIEDTNGGASVVFL